MSVIVLPRIIQIGCKSFWRIMHETHKRRYSVKHIQATHEQKEEENIEKFKGFNY